MGLEGHRRKQKEIDRRDLEWKNPLPVVRLMAARLGARRRSKP